MLLARDIGIFGDEAQFGLIERARGLGHFVEQKQQGQVLKHSTVQVFPCGGDKLRAGHGRFHSWLKWWQCGNKINQRHKRLLFEVEPWPH